MARFDFVEAASQGYKYVWHERRAIISLAATPLAVKMGSYAAISLFGLEDNFLRQGLVLLPAYFLEGFVVMLVIRMALFGEHYGNLFAFAPRGRSTIQESHKRSIMAGVAIYLLAKLISSFLSGGMMMGQQLDNMKVMPEPQGAAGTFVMTLMVMVFAIWSFRFFWLYVPVVMEVPVTVFLEKIKGFAISVYMIGLWVLCFVPMAALLICCAKLLITIMPVSDGSLSPIYIVLISAIQAVIELFVVLTSGVGMAFAVRSILTGDNKPPRFF